MVSILRGMEYALWGTKVAYFVEKIHKPYKFKMHFRGLDRKENKAIDVTRDKMKRRAFHLRSLIDSVKNKEAKKEVIQEYVSLISKMSRNN